MTTEPRRRTPGQLLRRLRAIKDRKDRIAGLEKKVNIEIKSIEQGLLPQALEDLGLESVSLPGVGSARLDVEVYPYVYKPNEQAFFEWLRENQEGALIKETVYPATLKKWAAGIIEEGAEYPEGLMRITTIPVVKFRRS